MSSKGSLLTIAAVSLLIGGAVAASVTLFNFSTTGTVSVTVTTTTYTPPPPQFVISGALLFATPPTNQGFNTSKATGTCTISSDGQSANCGTINLSYMQYVDPSGSPMSGMSGGQTEYPEVFYAPSPTGVECWNGHIPDDSAVLGRSICNSYYISPQVNVVSSDPNVIQDTELCNPSGAQTPGVCTSVVWSWASPHPLWYALIAQGNEGGGSATFTFTVSYSTS